MKFIFTLITTITVIIYGHSQNIGIDVQDPQFKLDIGGNLRIRNTAENTAGILFDGVTLPTRTFMGIFDNDRIGVKSTDTGLWPFLMNLNNGSIGIGNTLPAYDLDVKGRPRIRNSGSPAGIYFDGLTIPQASLIGTIDNNHVGIWGNNGANWNFAMNVENGFTGIGTSTPTSKLDINGNFRVRSSFPKTGSIMISEDANGNAAWADLVAFKAVGGLDNLPNQFTSGYTWSKVFFNQIASYNYGLSYQPINSEFLASENGIYHFETVLDWENVLDGWSVAIMLNRNGTITPIGAINKCCMYSTTQADEYGAGIHPSQLAVDVRLLQGDKVWVEASARTPNAPGYPNTMTVSANNFKTWFTGNLVTRL